MLNKESSHRISGSSWDTRIYVCVHQIIPKCGYNKLPSFSVRDSREKARFCRRNAFSRQTSCFVSVEVSFPLLWRVVTDATGLRLDSKNCPPPKAEHNVVIHQLNHVKNSNSWPKHIATTSGLLINRRRLSLKWITTFPLVNVSLPVKMFWSHPGHALNRRCCRNDQLVIYCGKR